MQITIARKLYPCWYAADDTRPSANRTRFRSPAPRRSRNLPAASTRAPQASSPMVHRSRCNAGARAQSLPRRGRPGAQSSPVCRSTLYPQPTPQAARRQAFQACHRWDAADAGGRSARMARPRGSPAPGSERQQALSGGSGGEAAECCKRCDGPPRMKAPPQISVVFSAFRYLTFR